MIDEESIDEKDEEVMQEITTHGRLFHVMLILFFFCYGNVRQITEVLAVPTEQLKESLDAEQLARAVALSEGEERTKKLVQEVVNRTAKTDQKIAVLNDTVAEIASNTVGAVERMDERLAGLDERQGGSNKVIVLSVAFGVVVVCVAVAVIVVSNKHAAARFEAAHQETVQALQETVQAHQETVQAHQKTVQAHKETVQAHKQVVQAKDETVQAQKEKVQALNDAVRAHQQKDEAKERAVRATRTSNLAMAVGFVSTIVGYLW